MPPSYLAPGVRLSRGAAAARERVKDLQRDLRKLGYLAKGIDGAFGKGTEQAVRALQHDLLHNAGKGSDGSAPVRVLDYNRGRVTSVSGLLDQKLAAAMADMLADPGFAQVPVCPDPAAENQKIAQELESMPSDRVPVPFLIAILKQESGLKHYSDSDGFVVLGLDRNATGTPAITSRGFGVGQYTLFHHPPSRAEVTDFVLDARANVTKAIGELLDKFLHYVNGSTAGTRADDRLADFGRGGLRPCKYLPGDPRHMTDCRKCLAAARTIDIKAGVTPLYAGASGLYRPTQYHAKTEYEGVPTRSEIGCDWPYAVRRYNGGGVNSYHYQTQVLLRVLDG